MSERSRATAIACVVLSIALVSVFQVGVAAVDSDARAKASCSATKARADAWDWETSAEVQAKMTTETSSKGETTSDHKWKEVEGSGAAEAFARSDHREAECATPAGFLDGEIVEVDVPTNVSEDRTYDGDILEDETTGDLWFVGTLETPNAVSSFNQSFTNDTLSFEYGNTTDEAAPPDADLNDTGADVTADFFEDADGQSVGNLTATD